MSEFTYNPPNDKKYFVAITKYLDKTGDNEISSLIRGGYCYINNSSVFSKKRWNAFFTEIIFYIPMDKIDSVTPDIGNRLLRICDKLMPPEVGFDVMSVDFSPILDDIEEQTDLTKNLEQMIKPTASFPSLIGLPEDILRKGRDMSEVYLYLYCVENSLRIFIETIGKLRHGSKYIEKLTIPAQVKKSIQVRKGQEAKNQWLRVRGESDIFYLDFKELGAVITNNWDVFSFYFPDQAWISTKIEELGNCRNLIAHNSYVGDHEKDVIRVYYTSIVKQINSSAIPEDSDPPF
ncbi:MAG: Swt1 family HEPN domain-containing protein [Nitrospiraceae bacterium]|nr:Swt1 family HEPN domain-containing protein [Nitrospiraceae bacterium]